MRAKIGDILLQPGDLLLVEADPGFDGRAGRSHDFLLVRSLEDSAPRNHARAPLAVLILLAMVAATTAGLYPMLVSALIAAAAMVGTRCCTLTDARRGIDWSILRFVGTERAFEVVEEGRRQQARREEEQDDAPPLEPDH